MLSFVVSTGGNVTLSGRGFRQYAVTRRVYICRVWMDGRGLYSGGRPCGLRYDVVNAAGVSFPSLEPYLERLKVET